MSRPTEARIVLARRLFALDLTDWTTWLAGGVGLAVAALVIVVVVLWGRWRRRRRLGFASTEEDLPWDQLLELLEKRSRERAAAGLPNDDDLPPDQLLQQLLEGLPSQRRGAADLHPEDWYGPAHGGAEKRANRRRWGNPTEVHLTWLAGPDRLHGLVINRSTGGLAIFVDMEVADGTMIQVRPAAAPYYVAKTTVEVRYCRKVGRSFLLGCRFNEDVPWNVRVWFG
jgi:PilZ domain